MKDIVVFIVIFGLLPFCILRPWIGIMVFSWISYMNPHRFCWGAAYNFPFAKIVAVATLIGFLFTPDKMALPKRRETVLIILLGIYFTFTSFSAFNAKEVWGYWLETIKILTMTIVTMMLINDRKKLKYLLLVIALSIGFFGFKGAIFSIVSGGQNRVFGPTLSFFADNNDLALALNMILPMLFFLSKNESNRRLRTLLMVFFWASILAIIFTYSRGGFLTLACVITLLLFKTRHKAVAVALVSGALILGLSVIPAKWYERINTIQSYEQDQSAMGRINAWHTAWNIAKDRPFTGGGFRTFIWQVFDVYAPDPSNVHDVHSIYFEVIGEHGFVAFGLFIALLLFALLSTWQLKKSVKGDADMQWATDYADMFRISLVAYAVGGIFLGRAYFDLFYHLVAMTVITITLVELEYAATEQLVCHPS